MVLSGLKERFEGCENLLGTSPIVRLTSSTKPQKPLIVTLTNPSGGSKNKRSTNGSGNDGSAGGKTPMLPQTQNNSGGAQGMSVLTVNLPNLILFYLTIAQFTSCLTGSQR